jgi:hypothetical protein
MKCWIKIAGTVLLIGFLGADVGLLSVLALNGTSPLAVAKPILSSLESAKITDAVQAISAVVVALFTVGLFWVGWQQAKILSEQHELSRRQAAIVERLQSPLISVEIETPGIEFNTAGLPRYRPSILKYRLKNHGDVPVFLLPLKRRFSPSN